MFLNGVGLHLVPQPQVDGEIGAQAPIVLYVCPENLIAYVMLVAFPWIEQICGRDRSARLVRQKVNQRTARRIQGALGILGADFVIARLQPGRKVGTSVYPVDDNDIILLCQKFKAELQSMVAPGYECIVIDLKDLVVEILVRRSPKLYRLRYICTYKVDYGYAIGIPVPRELAERGVGRQRVNGL